LRVHEAFIKKRQNGLGFPIFIALNIGSAVIALSGFGPGVTDGSLLA
jgi:hypothetical protein